MNAPRVYGLGSHHGDDQAGWIVIDRLRGLGYPSACLRKLSHPIELLDEWRKDQTALVCDACEFSGAGGAIRRWQWPADAPTGLRAGGTHDMPLWDVLELASRLSEGRRSFEIWGIAGTNWSPASPPSPLVEAAAATVATRIRERLDA